MPLTFNQVSPCFNNHVNSLPDEKILDWYKLKAFADDKIKLAKMMIFFFWSLIN